RWFYFGGGKRGKTASARAYSGPSVKDKLTERIRAALAGGMSVRKTAAKFDVNPSTDSVSPTLSRAPTTQASPARPSQINGPARPGQIKWSGPAAECLSSRRERAPLGGGRAKIENSSRRHPRRFGLKRFLAVRRSWRGNGVACFCATSLEEIIGGVIAIVSFRPGGWMQQSAVPRCAIRAQEASGSETPPDHNVAPWRRGELVVAWLGQP